jgi:hypothetical protein
MDQTNMDEQPKSGWPLERALFAVAGSATLVSVGLTVVVSKWFVLLAGLVGMSQWLYVLTGWCPASLVLRRTCSLHSAIYDEQSNAKAESSSMASAR